MNNYLLSIDPSIKNTGFTLWEKKYKYDKNLNYWPTREYVYCEIHNYENASLKIIKECKNCYENEIIWKPILVKSFDFKKYDNGKFLKEIEDKITDYCFFDNLNLIIERGIFNTKYGKGKETLDHLRGFIAGQFNKLLTKDMLVHNLTWKKWYIDNNITNISLKKWNKKISEDICFYLNEKYEWNINITNHDEADSLLIGWYYLNKEVNNET